MTTKTVFHPVSPEFAALDPRYTTMATLMSVDERIEYCEKVIDNAQNKLAHNHGLLGEELKTQLAQLVSAAQHEISHLYLLQS
jgi:hypothetical protein